MPDTLLIIEDEAVLGAELARHFGREGWEVARAHDLAAAKRMLIDESVDPLVVLSDMRLPDGSALDLLEQARNGGGSFVEWILMTGYGTISDSVRGLRLGAFDFLEKPCDIERLELVVAGAARSARAQRQLREQRAHQNRRHGVDAFIGASPAAAAVREFLARLAGVPVSTLLLTGETGTGKGLAARIVHYSGKRGGGPLVEVNCAALPRDLLESELFGHEAGAFTGSRGRRRGLLEQAHDGTLFLDEISEMPLDLQAKLLKAIEDRTFRRVGGNEEQRVEVQIVASSNRDLRQAAADGTFRADLYHRLSVFTLELPSLRSRITDVDDLLPAFIAEFNAKAGKAVRVVPPLVRTRLLSHAWPGNVRELRNVVERCVLLSNGEEFPARWLHLDRDDLKDGASAGAGAGRYVHLPLDGTMTLDEMDREVIRAALEATEFNTAAAARLLGSTRQTLRYRVQKYGLRAADED